MMAIKKLLFIGIWGSIIQANIRTPHMPQQQDTVELPTFRRQQKIESKEREITSPTIRKGVQNISYHKSYKEMNFDELWVAKDKQVEKNNLDTVIIYLERLIKLCDDGDTSKKAELIIELADIQFKKEFFDDAAKRYKEFIQLYPGSKQAEYAHYRAIECTSMRILSSDRDQTKTEETIDLANQFLERSTFTQFKLEVESIRRSAYETLAQSELNVGEFYIKQGDYPAAQRRLETVRIEWLAKAPEIEFRLAQLETDLSIQFEPYTAPQSSLLLVNATQEIKPKKKDMAMRF